MFVLCVAAAGVARAAEPDPATLVPGDTDMFLTVRDAKALVPPAVEFLEAVDDDEARAGRVFLQELAQIATGRASAALTMPKDEHAEPALLLVLPVDQSKLKADDVIEQGLKRLAGEDKMDFKTVGGIHEAGPKNKPATMFWTIRDGILLVAGAREHLAPIDPTASLAQSAGYRRTLKHTGEGADVAGFVNLEVLWRKIEKPGDKPQPGMLAPQRVLYKWLAADQFQAVGLSWKGDGETGSGRFAVLTGEARRGLAAALDVPNKPLKNLERIPANCQLFSFAAPVAKTLVPRLATLMGDLDPDIRREFEDELAEFNKELGVDLEKDLLGAAGTVITAARMPGAGQLAVFNVIELADPAAFQKCAEALARYNETPLRKVERNGRSFHVLPTKPAVGYTFDANRMYFSNSFEAIEEALALKPGDKTLADDEPFKKLRARLPQTCVMMWAVDANWGAQFALLARTFVPQIGEMVPASAASKFLEQFQVAGPGLSIGLALRNEPDAFVLHIESLSGDLWKILPTAATLFLKPVLE